MLTSEQKKSNIWNTSSILEKEVTVLIQQSNASATQHQQLIDSYLSNDYDKLVPSFLEAFPMFDSYAYCKDFAKRHNLATDSDPNIVKVILKSFMHAAERIIERLQKI